jgi:hypothetical protein
VIGGTVGVAEVYGEEARGIITELLRTGGARICVHTAHRLPTLFEIYLH